ncbi:MAG: hypothetical protein RJA22_3079 [Verrucomicrobiota bacterium]|jgi:hypothetical protein
MTIESLHIGMKVRHPQYGAGIVKSLTAQAAEIRFDDGPRTIDPATAGLEADEAQVSVGGTTRPLAGFIQETARAVVDALGLEKPGGSTVELGRRWHQGRLVLHPADPTLQTKELPIEDFFHKIVMMRNNLRVLEQKINAHEKLAEAEKIELQGYLTRCYGSMTTFNVLFKEKEGQF